MRKTWKKAAAGMCAAMMALSVANVGPAVMQVEAQTPFTDATYYHPYATNGSATDIEAKITTYFKNDMSVGTLVDYQAGQKKLSSFEKLFDNSNTKADSILYLAANPEAGDYIQLDFKSPIDLTAIEFQMDRGAQYGYSTSATLQYKTATNDEFQTLTTTGNQINKVDTSDEHSTDRTQIGYYKYEAGTGENLLKVTSIRLTSGYSKGGRGWTVFREIYVDGTVSDLAGNLEIATLPSKTVYKVGEVLNTAGLVVKQYTSNTEKETIADYTVSGFDSSSTGKKTVTVSKAGKSTSFDVYIYEPGGFYPQQALTVATGSEEGRTDGDGPLAYAFDGNIDTRWHSRYSADVGTGAINNLSEAWVTMEFEDATIVDGLQYTPRHDTNGNNGNIKTYEIQGSLDGQEFFKLADGTWSGTKDQVQTLSFPAVKLKALKLIPKGAVGTTVASAAEINVRTAETEDEFYLGTSLRMDYQDDVVNGEEVGFTKTGLRFGYTFPKTLNGMNVSDWDWKYGLDATVTHGTDFDGMPKYVEKGDNYVSNLVIGGTNIQNAIGVDKYQTTYYSCISVTYRDEAAGLYETICSPVTSDNVYAFAGRAIDLGKDKVGEATYEYAQGIKKAWDATQNNN